MNKALIKSTGEILEIKSEYAAFTINVSFGSNYSDKIKEMFDSYKIDVGFDPKDAIDYTIPPNDIKIDSEKSLKIDRYVLSDGNSYDKSELIVGVEDIRDSKIDNFLQNGI